MIDRKIVAQKIREFEIQEYVQSHLQDVGLSKTKLQLTPMGEKIIIYTSRPGLIVGRKGQSIKKLTGDLKREFGLDHPQIEINEVENVNLDAYIVAERIANSLERFGINRFKGVGHKAMENVMNAGGLGIEILISGKVPSARARTWRFYMGYMKKCGEFASHVRRAYAVAKLKSGIVGIQVAIMPGDLRLPDDIEIRPVGPIVEDVTGKAGAELQQAIEIAKEHLAQENVSGATGEKSSASSESSSKTKKPRKRKPKAETSGSEGKLVNLEKTQEHEVQGTTEAQ